MAEGEEGKSEPGDRIVLRLLAGAGELALRRKHSRAGEQNRAEGGCLRKESMEDTQTMSQLESEEEEDLPFVSINSARQRRKSTLVPSRMAHMRF
ncbi:hypothetical protein SKAU_G00407260 [Synaphobranchus kaupii]|uniref:Uncharacterized protein n=1 Tax=Synaphobranchus kaupii TaxID=118154 RepID=A0A9Q1ICZ8_SYNKA|nr:hypothetical protein SKAU_G00407260 [Synaphobranchus kaupii]